MKKIAALLLALGTACGSGAVPTSIGTTPPPTPVTDDLPSPVSRTRDAILKAAKAFDYDGLAALADHEGFTFSFGDDTNPAAYWRTMEQDNHVPLLGDTLPSLFATSHGLTDGIYVWPRAFRTDPKDWTESDRDDLRKLYNDEDISMFESNGYVGYRVGIKADGTWVFFVAGD